MAGEPAHVADGDASLGGPGLAGMSLGWLSAHAVPHWLTRAALKHGVRSQDLARLTWRVRLREIAALEVAALWLRQALVDIGAFLRM
jgi:hypothetical protein